MRRAAVSSARSLSATATATAMALVLSGLIGCKGSGGSNGGSGGAAGDNDGGGDNGSGGQNLPPTNIKVSVTPSTATVDVGQTAQFSATVSGTSNTAVKWTTSGGTISDAGLYTAPALGGNYIVTASSVADARAFGTAQATVNGTTLSQPEPVFDTTVAPAIYLNDPIQGMEFLAPATVTMLASSWDNDAPMQVQFMVGDQVAATVTSNANPSDAANFMLRGMAQNLAAGTHELWVRETSRNGATHDSAHITITVKAPPAYAADHQLVLTADLMLSGDMQLLGTADQPFLIQGNGHSIVAPAGWAGHLTIRNAHVRDLGALPGTEPSPKALAINVQTTGGVDIQDSLFEHCGEVRVQADGNATVTFKGNTMNENTAVSVTSLSYAESSLAPPTPIVHFFGSSKAPKTFTGNRVYMGWSEFDNPHSWTIGGDTDADSNIMMGPRAGILMFQNQDGTGNNRVSGNDSVLHCPNRWTQCSNFIFSNAGRGNIVERNLLVGGWILQGFAGELRYNVITTGGEDFMREFGDNTQIHHNIINYLGYLWPGDPSDVIDLYASNGVSAKGIEMFNNTFDGGGAALKLYGPAIRLRGVTVHSIRNNAFVHFPYYLGLVVSGIRDMETKAGPQPYADYLDYNAFFNPEKKAAAPLSYYLKTTTGAAAGAPGFGGHDVGGLNKDVDPLFSGKDTSGVYPFSRADIWARKAKVSLMLQYFANYYRPGSGSPLTDAGDPADGDGTDVGAVDSGKPNSKYGGIADFGK